jgi:hypothetical protein
VKVGGGYKDLDVFALHLIILLYSVTNMDEQKTHWVGVRSGVCGWGGLGWMNGSLIYKGVEESAPPAWMAYEKVFCVASDTVYEVEMTQIVWEKNRRWLCLYQGRCARMINGVMCCVTMFSSFHFHIWMPLTKTGEKKDRRGGWGLSHVIISTGRGRVWNRS